MTNIRLHTNYIKINKVVLLIKEKQKEQNGIYQKVHDKLCIFP